MLEKVCYYLLIRGKKHEDEKEIGVLWEVPIKANQQKLTAINKRTKTVIQISRHLKNWARGKKY